MTRNTSRRPESGKSAIPRLSEARWQAQVVKLARMLGWAVYHTFNSRRSAAGFPDLVLVHPGDGTKSGRVIFAELKAEDGRTTPEQTAWLDALLHCDGVEVHLWKPSNWPAVVQTLTEVA